MSNRYPRLPPANGRPNNWTRGVSRNAIKLRLLLPHQYWMDSLP